MLLSTIGSRGEVQPMVGLAVRLRELGHEVRVVVPPDFTEWIAGMGIPATPIGPSLRPTATRSAPNPLIATPEQRQRMLAGTVVTQFATIPDAAKGCDVLVGCGALQVAARSIAEVLGIAYVHVHYCPITLPSPHHAPPRLGWPVDATASYAQQWAADAERWAENWGPALNAERAKLGLDAVADVRDHVFTDQPWLAADPVLGPWPGDLDVVQTGAWFLEDGDPLPESVEEFLAAGAPPVYFGLGSMSAPGADVGEVMVKAARAVGRRAIISRGWADVPLADEGTDCIRIGDVNHAALFTRVAAVVHHGGAGTTATVARAGVPQVVVPQRYDQPYWAGRVAELGIGVALPQGMPTTEDLTAALDQVLYKETTARANATEIRTNGTTIAAERLMITRSGDHPENRAKTGPVVR